MTEKAVPIFLASMLLLLAGCASTCTPDRASSVQVAIAATLTTPPAETSLPIPTLSPTRTLIAEIASTVQVAVAATLTAQPTETSVPAPTETPLPTPTETPACTPTRELAPTWPATPIATSSRYTHTLGTYRGRGFSFQYPVGARLAQVPPGKDPWQRVSLATDEIHVIGPQVWIKAGDADWGYRGPAYELVIRTYENPQGQDAESWARNYLLVSWREAQERNRPRGSLPVSEAGEIDERRVESVVVAGRPSFLAWFFTFDSTTPAYYVATDRQIVELSFRLHIVENVPIAKVQRDVYVLILNTFRLEGSEVETQGL
jgi:hypothetical protein